MLIKIRTDFVTNSSSSRFVVINVKSDILTKVFNESGLDLSYLQALSDYLDGENGVPYAITDSLAETVCNLIEEIIDNELYGYYEDWDVEEETIEELINKIKTRKEEIDLEAEADIESGKAHSDSGGPNFSYAHLTIKKGKGKYVGFSAEDDYYGNDDDPSPLYKWAKKHGYYDPENEEPGFEGGYDHEFYFMPPFDEMEESYKDATRIDIDYNKKN